MEIEQLEKREKELYAATNYFRLLKDLEAVEGEIAKNEPFSSDSEKSAIVNFWNKNVVNTVRKKNNVKLSAVKNDVLSETEVFKEKAAMEGTDISVAEDGEKLKAELNEFFFDDKYGIRRLFFGIRLVLERDVNVKNSEKTLEETSLLLFGERSKLANIEADLRDNYVAIFKKPMTDIEKGILIGMGIFAAVSVAALPLGLALGASSSAVITSCLAQLGHSAPYIIGQGIVNVTAAAALSSVVILGGTYLGAEVVKKIKECNLKETFRKLSAKDLSVIFAIKATVIQHARKVVSEGNMKEVLDDCLKQINDLRSDAEYMLIVEKLNAEQSREKIAVCNRLTQRLADIVGI